MQERSISMALLKRLFVFTPIFTCFNVADVLPGSSSIISDAKVDKIIGEAQEEVSEGIYLFKPT